MNKLRNTDILIKFGSRLNALRKSQNLTLEQLAFAAEVEISQIHRIEKGKINPSLTTLIAISKGLNIKLPELVDDENLFMAYKYGS
jgi:transcriptional regulator with XRE-family HTH domain